MNWTATHKQGCRSAQCAALRPDSYPVRIALPRTVRCSRRKVMKELALARPRPDIVQARERCRRQRTCVHPQQALPGHLGEQRRRAIGTKSRSSRVGHQTRTRAPQAPHHAAAMPQLWVLEWHYWRCGRYGSWLPGIFCTSPGSVPSLSRPRGPLLDALAMGSARSPTLSRAPESMRQTLDA